MTPGDIVMTASETPQSAPSSPGQPASAGSKAGGQTNKMPAEPGPTRKKPPVVLILVLLLAAGGATWYFNRPKIESKQIHVSGRIEGYETNVGPKVGGRIDFISSRGATPLR
jgi:HlyD family secretion protein